MGTRLAVRVHATTGEQPVVLWRQEQLTPLGSIARYQLVEFVPRAKPTGRVTGDPVMASAALDRLLHRSTVINIRGESFRLKEKRRAGSSKEVAP